MVSAEGYILLGTSKPRIRASTLYGPARYVKLVGNGGYGVTFRVMLKRSRLCQER
jgi:hypothetical protein